MTNLELTNAIRLIQRAIKAAALRGDIKDLRYLNTALHNIKIYLQKKGEDKHE